MDEKPVSASTHSMVSEKIDGFDGVETGTVASYSTLYERIFWDLGQAEDELSGESIGFANLIHAAAHLRLVIEGVSIASFTASHVLFAQVNLSMHSAKDYNAMRKSVRKLNPHYWPKAFRLVEHNGQTGLGVCSEVGLQESEVGPYFGTVSELLHVQNPFSKKKATPDQYLEDLRLLIGKLQELLGSHIVQLAEASEFLYLRHVDNRILVQAIKSDRPLLTWRQD